MALPECESSEKPENNQSMDVTASPTANTVTEPKAGIKCPRFRPRIHVAQDKLWETIAGHGMDHSRLPRSLWDALLGIASSKDQGILQGDLGRLVNQDKRSLPKRTDVLASRGYIVKRATLSKGFKTSKMWLKQFAPEIPRLPVGTDHSSDSGLTLSREVLIENMDPVPWHDRWTGDSIDFVAFARTLMAIIKEWRVLRMTDLKTKMAVHKKRWHMRVMARSCRFLASRGCIKYVAARKEHRLFKDCVKFVRDLGSEDWRIFLETGKQDVGRRRLISTGGRGAAHEEQPDQTACGDKEEADKSSAPLSMRAAAPGNWTADCPLSVSISRLVHLAGEKGLSTNEVVYLTLGDSFHRYVFTLCGYLSYIVLQPEHLRHFQIRRENARKGKAIEHRFLPVSNGTDPGTEASDERGATRFGFAKLRPKLAIQLHSLPAGKLAQDPATSSRKKRESRPDEHAPSRDLEQATQRSARAGFGLSKAKNNVDQGVEPGENCLEAGNDVGTRRASGSTDLQDEQATADTRPSCQEILPEHDQTSLQGESTKAAAAAAASASETGNGTGKAKPASRGRPPKKGIKSTSSNNKGESKAVDLKVFRCEKCAGEWKNDVGLKYHLTKSKTSCNESWVPVQAKANRRDEVGGSYPHATTMPEDQAQNHRSQRKGLVQSDGDADYLLPGLLERDQAVESRGYGNRAPPLYQIHRIAASASRHSGLHEIQHRGNILGRLSKQDKGVVTKGLISCLGATFQGPQGSSFSSWPGRSTTRTKTSIGDDRRRSRACHVRESLHGPPTVGSKPTEYEVTGRVVAVILNVIDECGGIFPGASRFGWLLITLGSRDTKGSNNCRVRGLSLN